MDMILIGQILIIGTADGNILFLDTNTKKILYGFGAM